LTQLFGINNGLSHAIIMRQSARRGYASSAPC
jgi:hypothetical protein